MAATSPVLDTAFTRLTRAQVPIQVAPMPFHGAPDLAVAVAGAGGLGMVGLPMHSAQDVERVLSTMVARTGGVLGANFLIPFLDPDCVRVAAAHARVVEFFYGEPDEKLVDTVHRGGALAGWQVGSMDEAVAADRAGCDYVVAQGTEAGGHVRGHERRDSLLAAVVAGVRCPVIAAGGIATPEALASVLAAGAAGARIGTRFLGAIEADVHDEYRRRLFAARAADTVLTEAFSAGWPEAPHRVLRSAVEQAQSGTSPVVGRFTLPTGSIEIPRGAVFSPTRSTKGEIGALALYAGEGVDAVTKLEPAAAIVDALVRGAAKILEIRGGVRLS